MLAVLYPLMTLFVVIGTANHYLLDAVGGVAVTIAGFAVVSLWPRGSPRLWSRC